MPDSPVDPNAGKATEALINLVLDALRAGKDFAMEQLPDVAREIVTWGRAWYTLSAVVLLAGACWLAYLARSFFLSYGLQDTEEGKNGCILCTIALFVLAVVCTVLSCVQSYEAVMAWSAPKVYILHELKLLK